MGLSDQLAINLLARDGLYEISIRLNRSMWRERRRLDVTVPNSGKLEIYLSNLPAARFSSSATLVLWQFFIIRKWVVTLMRQILNVVQDVGPSLTPLNASAYIYSVGRMILKLFRTSFRIEKIVEMEPRSSRKKNKKKKKKKHVTSHLQELIIDYTRKR